MHPFINVKAMSDDEIIKQLAKYRSYLNDQTQYGRNDVITSIKGIIDALEFEKLDRVSIEKVKKDLGTDNSELKPINLGRLEGEVDEPIAPRKTKNKPHGIQNSGSNDKNG